MPSPSGSSPTSKVGQPFDPKIRALTHEDKWGGPVGTGTSLTFSFPWNNGASAFFSGPNGQAYSDKGEWTASFRTGLNSVQQTAFKAALQSWANVANITFTEVSDNSSTVGDIRIAFTSASETSGFWGYAYYPNSGWSSGGDIWINSKLVYDSDWSVGSDNFQSLIHEIGHSLGLDHPNGDAYQSSQQYTVMSYNPAPKSVFIEQSWTGQSWLSYVYPDTPMLDDIAAIQYLYGANKSYKTGNDTYTFDSSKPFFRTIWDGGGNDTIDCSNLFKSLSIDLTEGSFSSIRNVDSLPLSVATWSSLPTIGLYDGTNNLAIAYGTVIENAVGGSAADYIKGNSAANKLSGSWGNDSLFGETGDDTLEGGDGNDLIYGGSGNDSFDWDVSSRAGRDSFYGGTGNDVYVLTEGDQVIELANEGFFDTVWVSNSYTIASDQFVEQLFGFGTSSMTLTGSSRGESIRGSTSGDSLVGNAGDDYLWGMEGADTLLGGEGNDNLMGGIGDDTLNGGIGQDTVWFENAGSNYNITRNSDGTVRVADQRMLAQMAGGPQADGTDILTGIEKLRFTDISVLFDTQGAPGQAYRLYKAAFDREPDLPGLGFWIKNLSTNWTLKSVADAFIGSPEFASLYGSKPSDAAFIDLLYRNVLDRAPEPAGFAGWQGALSGGTSRADVLIGFSESPENNNNVATLIANGIRYVEWTA